MRKVPFYLSVLFVMLAFAGLTQAATVEKLTLPELVQHSTQIVTGSVTDIASAWNDDHTQIYTTITFEVSECIKGKASGMITFTQLGGVAEGIRVSVPGFPVFRKGSDVLLFLSGSKDMPTVGLGQGKFDIIQDEITGEKVVANDVFGLETIGKGNSLTEIGSMGMSLADMKQSIRDIIGQSTEQKK